MSQTMHIAIDTHERLAALEVVRSRLFLISISGKFAS